MNQSGMILGKLTALPAIAKFFRRFSSVSIGNADDLIVKLDGNHERFPLVWLRDNCRCEKCFHPGSQSRIINWNEFKIDAKVRSIETNSGSGNVTINWDDDHRSKFSFEWLKERRFAEGAQKSFLENVHRPPKIAWDGKDFTKVVKRYDYNEVMSNDRRFYEWLKDLAVFGAVFMENAPLDKKESFKLANKIAFIRKTHYGEEFYVVAKPGAGNVAYLSSFLQLHTDLPYYHYKPGVTILHCIIQHKGEGGENLLTDGFFIAEKLRQENSEAFDILSKVDVNWIDIGVEDGTKYHKVSRAPIISLDSKGNFDSVHHSVPHRDSYFTVDLKYVKPWYKAFKEFVDLINKHSATFKTKPGDMFAFDNTRLIHGRLGYEDTSDNQRFLVGFYLDWDEVYSKMRVLQNEIKSG